MSRVKLELTVEDVDFIIMVLGAVPTLQTVQANKIGLIPLIKEQAQFSLHLQQKEAEEEAMRDKVRILREARIAAEREARIRQHEQDKMRDDIERDGFITALGGENVPLRDILAEQARQMQNVAPGSRAYVDAMKSPPPVEEAVLTKEPESPLTPHGEEIARKEAAEANIRNQQSLREKLDQIAKSEGRIGDPPFPHTQRFG